MSLTSMLKGKKDMDIRIQSILREYIPKKKEFLTLSDKDAFSSAYIIEAPYNLNKTHDSSVVGTAFDYLARFIVAQKIISNKHSVLEDLTANWALKIIHRHCEKKIAKAIEAKYDNGMKQTKNFIDNKDATFDEIIPYASFLARLEIISRSGMLPNDVKGSLLGQEDKKIYADLIRLCEVFNERFMIQEVIKPDSTVVFNPHFGLASISCGGADADIYIDGTLYDFKTSKMTGYRWIEIAQIFGYYYLNCIATRLNDHKASLKGFEIKRLAFYRARFGEIEYVDIGGMDKKKMNLVVHELEDLLGLRTEGLGRAKSSLRMVKHADEKENDSSLLNKVFISITALIFLLVILFVYMSMSTFIIN